MAKNNNLEQDSMANVEEALTASERVIEKNQKAYCDGGVSVKTDAK